MGLSAVVWFPVCATCKDPLVLGWSREPMISLGTSWRYRKISQQLRMRTSWANFNLASDRIIQIERQEANAKMSTAYKALESNDQLGRDSDDESTSSNASSATIGRSSESPTMNPTSLPIELKNRILILTSRGLSHRCSSNMCFPFLCPD
jgi:hypothetical protein